MASEVAMQYLNGLDAKVGDVVMLGDRETGVVVCSFTNAEYCPGYESFMRRHTSEGILIDFPTYGLMHFKFAEVGLTLLSRRTG
jgi:hypothetical protein